MPKKTKPLTIRGLKKSGAKEVGTRLREWREEMDWTRADAEKQTGIPATTIANLEYGKHYPSGEQIVALSKVYGVSPNNILSGSDDYFPKTGEGYELSSMSNDDLVDMVLPFIRLHLAIGNLNQRERESVSQIVMSLARAKLSGDELGEFNLLMTSTEWFHEMLEESPEFQDWLYQLKGLFGADE